MISDEASKDDGANRVSTEQWIYLLNAVGGDMELRGNFTGGNGKSRTARKWNDLARELNIIVGVHKDGRQWHAAYTNLKSRAKGALAAKVSYMHGTGGGPPLDTEEDLSHLGLSEVYAKCIMVSGIKTAALGNRSVPNPLQVQRQVGAQAS